MRDSILAVVREVRADIVEREAAGFRAIARLLDGLPPERAAMTTPTPPADEPVVVTDDGPSPDEVAGGTADLAPQPPAPPVAPQTPPVVQPEPPKRQRGRPKKAADVPPVDAEDIPAAPDLPAPPPPVVDDIPWGGPVTTTRIASGFGDPDDTLPPDDAADPDASF